MLRISAKRLKTSLIINYTMTDSNLRMRFFSSVAKRPIDYEQLVSDTTFDVEMYSLGIDILQKYIVSEEHGTLKQNYTLKRDTLLLEHYKLFQFLLKISVETAYGECLFKTACKIILHFQIIIDFIIDAGDNGLDNPVQDPKILKRLSRNIKYCEDMISDFKRIGVVKKVKIAKNYDY